LDHATEHESCHLLLLICMSFVQQSAPTETRSLFAIKEKRKMNSQKKNSPRMLLVAEPSFAIDAQQDTRNSLRHWHPGRILTIQQN
jgi:hypothetical protein